MRRPWSRHLSSLGAMCPVSQREGSSQQAPSVPPGAANAQRQNPGRGDGNASANGAPIAQ